MAFNLLDSVQSLFSNDIINRAASSFGESDAGVTKAISGMVPTILGGIVSKATSDINGATSVLNLAKNSLGGGILGNLGNLFGSGGSSMLSSGLDIAKNLFGDKLNNAIHAISNFAGIKESSGTTLMSMIAPAALGVIGKHASENNLSANGLSNLLSSQKSSIFSALPSGLGSLASTLGLGSIGAAVSSMASGARHAAGTAMHSAESAIGKTERGSRWWIPLLLGLLVLLLVYFFMRSPNKESASAVTTMDTVASTAMTMSPSPVSIKVKLPDGTELDAYQGGIEDMLVSYLNSTNPADSISSSRWFDFDNLNFQTGSTELTEESMKQVQNIAAILKAYPNAKIKIGGYTDKTGNEPDNMKLSQGRAESVVAALKKLGAPNGQLAGAEGYGSQYAKAAADAPDEERKKDRRISISVRAK